MRVNVRLPNESCVSTWVRSDSTVFDVKEEVYRKYGCAPVSFDVGGPTIFLDRCFYLEIPGKLHGPTGIIRDIKTIRFIVPGFKITNLL